LATVELQTIRHRGTMVETITNDLIRYIARNGLRGGDRLPSERELVGKIGVSRLPLREALSVLKGLGIIEARHGKGIFVKELDPAAIFNMLSPLLKVQAGIEVQHLFEARLLLETGAAELAALHRTEEHLLALEGELEAMRAAIRRRSVYVAHDRAFHQAIAQAAGNPVLVVFMASLTDLLAELHERFRDRIEFRQAAIREHEEIFDAIRRQNAVGAREAIERHLSGALKRI